MIYKVTFFINTLSGGGAEGVCVNLANGLARRGIPVDLVVLNLKKRDYYGRIDKDVNFINLRVSHSRYAFGAIKSYLKTSDAKVVLSFNYEISVLLVLVRQLSALSYKIIGRNIIAFSQRKKNMKGLWRKYVASKLIDVFFVKVDHVVNQCRAMEGDLLSIYPSLRGKTSVIYNPAMLLSEDLEERKVKQYVLCVGRLEEQKAFDVAIKAFSLFHDANPDFRLKIVGQGSLEKPLKNLVESLNLASVVDFEGFQTDVAEFYQGAACTLLTSRFEGFPNVLLESIGVGTPVVAVDCPSGPSEIVVNGLNGALVQGYSEKEIANQLESVCGRRWEKSQLRKSIEKFHLNNVLSQYQLMFEEVLFSS